MANLSTSLKQLMSLIGCQCVYKDSGQVVHAELVRLSLKSNPMENFKGNRLKLTLKPIASPGFSKGPSRSFSIECVEEYLCFNKNRIFAQMVNWELFFVKADVKRLVELVATKPTDQAFINEVKAIRREADHKNKHPTSVERK